MLFLPEIAHAQDIGSKLQSSPAGPVITKIIQYILLPIIEGFFLFTLLIFVWGVVGLIAHADDADARKEGSKHVLWGVIGLFIMISAYAIIRVIAATLAPLGPEVVKPF
jgi:hypothetical protein